MKKTIRFLLLAAAVFASCSVFFLAQPAQAAKTAKTTKTAKVTKTKKTAKASAPKDIYKKTFPKAVISEAYAVQDGSISLVFDGRKKKSHYVIYRASAKDGKYKEIARTKKTKYTDRNVKTYREYYYKVAAADKKGKQYTVGKMSRAVRVKARKPYTKIRLTYVGDSLMEGITAFGHMKAKKERIISKIGINSIRFYQSSKMSQLLADKPDQMVIMLGMNGMDGKPGNSFVRKQVQYMELILKACLKKNPNMEIILSGVTPYRRHTGAPASTRIWYNKQLKKFAKEHDGVWYCDPAEVFDQGDGYLIRKYAAGDGYHLRRSGYTLLVKFWRNFVKKLKYK